MKRRDIATSIILTIVTCGIYGLFWFITLTDDLNYLHGTAEITGGKALAFTLITCGIYGIYWAYKMGVRIDEVKTQHGEASANSGIIYLILSIFGLGIVGYALMQSEINKYMPNNA